MKHVGFQGDYNGNQQIVAILNGLSVITILRERVPEIEIDCPTFLPSLGPLMY